MAMGSYLGFFICAAAFRSFRARNLEAAILLFSATVIMLKNIPIGNVIIPGIFSFGNWYNDVVAFGGNRGLIIVMGVGMIVAGIRQLLGFERGEM
jgi:predicted phage tail protein